tara:strand:+ start:1703 stop:2170 length:468 start_codon:yes stop_codon:yes gene_type:complete
MISNATPIICLGKINKLRLLKDLYGSIIIPEAVKKEVLVKSKPGFSAIKEAIGNKWIQIETPKKELQLGLGKGENAAISLAKEMNKPLIIDDGRAIKAAQIHGVPVIRTTTLLFQAVKEKKLSKEQALADLNKLIEQGYYISPRLYVVLADTLRK